MRGASSVEKHSSEAGREVAVLSVDGSRGGCSDRVKSEQPFQSAEPRGALAARFSSRGDKRLVWPPHPRARLAYSEASQGGRCG